MADPTDNTSSIPVAGRLHVESSIYHEQEKV